MNRAAREGRYCGGIVAFGYRVEGHQASARLVPDQAIVGGDLSAAGLVHQIYERIALGGWSCRRVAAELNALGVPTAYAREGRGVRGHNTQNVWRAGRIRNMVANPVYKGQLQYGRRTGKRDREVIAAPIEGLVSPALWAEAQEALARNRRCAKNTHRVYLLKGVLKCGICGLTYAGSWSKEFGWYRCGGQLVERGPVPGKCLGVSVRTDRVEPAIWADIEAWLRNPGDVLDKLDGVTEREAQGAIAEAEAVTLTRRLETLDSERRTALDLRIRGHLPDDELDQQLDRITQERASLEARVAALQAPGAEIVPQEARDLLDEVRASLDAGLTDEQRQEIVRLLAGIVVHTSVGDDGKKTAKALVTYRFPGVVVTRTGTGSSLR
jgi:site-specific DNA recombinase